MKLAALGVVAVVIGVALGVSGLIGIGAFWVAVGFPARIYGTKFKAALAAAKAEGKSASVDGRTFALGTLLWLGLGVPSLAVGILELGIPAEHQDWRWLPIVVGGYALVIGVFGSVLYLAGSAVGAAADTRGTPSVPAVLRIRAVRETGTFINERPRLEFDFLVEPEATSELAAYEVTKKATVPFTAMGSLRVGGGFTALVVGPESPTSMEINWDEPVPDSDPAEGAAGLDVSGRLDELDRLLREERISQEEHAAQRQRILGSL